MYCRFLALTSAKYCSAPISHGFLYARIADNSGHNEGILLCGLRGVPSSGAKTHPVRAVVNLARLLRHYLLIFVHRFVRVQLHRQFIAVLLFFFVNISVGFAVSASHRVLYAADSRIAYGLCIFMRYFYERMKRLFAVLQSKWLGSDWRWVACDPADITWQDRPGNQGAGWDCTVSTCKNISGLMNCRHIAVGHKVRSIVSNAVYDRGAAAPPLRPRPAPQFFFSAVLYKLTARFRRSCSSNGSSWRHGDKQALITLCSFDRPTASASHKERHGTPLL